MKEMGIVLVTQVIFLRSCKKKRWWKMSVFEKQTWFLAGKMDLCRSFLVYLPALCCCMYL